MITRNNLIVLAFLAFVLGLSCLDSKIANGPTPLAVYKDRVGVVNVYSYELNPVIVEGVLLHEAHHANRDLGLIDFDIPTAAALGYVMEWSKIGSLSDTSRIPALRHGLMDLSDDSSEILRKYVGDQEHEPITAYDDGAILAGIALRLCGGTLEGGGTVSSRSFYWHLVRRCRAAMYRW